jgi:hypothetical protein
VIRALVAIACLSCVGCSQGYTHFEHPVVDEHGPAVDPVLVGDWTLELDSEPADPADPEQGDEKPPDVSISPDGEISFRSDAGEPDARSKPQTYRIVTARIGNDTIASLKTGPGDDDTWAYFHYWVSGPGVVSFSSDGNQFWKRAVRDRMVSGRIEKTGSGDGTTITASGAELRSFMLGYGRVIFDDASPGRLHRRPAPR